jgi:chromosome segregation ATPase
MEPKNYSTINLSLKEQKDIEQYCKLNKIEDVPSFLRACWIQGYEIKKFGLLGKTGGIEEKWVEKEVIVEKWVEIPVEVIKEVEKIVEVIKEVPVEKIVEITKEVPVEKVVIKEVVKEIPVEVFVTKTEYISDDTKTNELLLKIQQLEDEKQEFSTKTSELTKEVQKFSTITQEMENIFHDKMSKKDKELYELRHSLDELLDKPPIIKEVLVQDNTALDELLLERTVLNKRISELENIQPDNSKQIALQETIQKLRSELQLKNKEITDLKTMITEFQSSQDRQGIFLDGSNLNRTINRK